MPPATTRTTGCGDEFVLTLLEDGGVAVGWVGPGGTRRSATLLDDSLAADILTAALMSIADGSR